MNTLRKFIDLTIESLKDNKKLIIGLYLLFIVCFVGAWFLSAPRIQTLVSNISALSTPTTTPNMANSVGAIELFISNEFGGIVTYLGSIFFGIPAIVLLMYNGINIGFQGQLFNTVIPNGGLKFIVYLIPHGIFEITATVLESVAGILLFMFIWKFIKAWRSSETRGVSDSFEKTKKILIQSIMIFIFSTILLAIAAPLEAYFSLPFSQFILGV